MDEENKVLYSEITKEIDQGNKELNEMYEKLNLIKAQRTDKKNLEGEVKDSEVEKDEKVSKIEKKSKAFDLGYKIGYGLAEKTDYVVNKFKNIGKRKSKSEKDLGKKVKPKKEKKNIFSGLKEKASNVKDKFLDTKVGDGMLDIYNNFGYSFVEKDFDSDFWKSSAKVLGGATIVDGIYTLGKMGKEYFSENPDLSLKDVIPFASLVGATLISAGVGAYKNWRENKKYFSSSEEDKVKKEKFSGLKEKASNKIRNVLSKGTDYVVKGLESMGKYQSWK